MWKTLCPPWTLLDEKRFIRRAFEHYGVDGCHRPFLLKSGREWLLSYLYSLRLRHFDFAGDRINPALIDKLETFCIRLLAGAFTGEEGNGEKKN
jgi:hypothetical protein